VRNETLDTLFSWTVVAGPCEITGGEFEKAVIYSFNSTLCPTTNTCEFAFFVDDPTDADPDGDTCTIEVECECPPEGACQATFWAAANHFGQWPSGYCASNTCGTPATPFCSVNGNRGVFNCTSSASQSAFGGKTLREVMQMSGTSLKNLGRHGAAAILNSQSSAMDFDYSPLQVKNKVNAAIAGSMSMFTVTSQLAAANLEGCPMNGSAYCGFDLNLDGSVSTQDLNALMANWGRPGTGDINSDGIVGPNDLMILMAHWGSY
jgi:hypothetical protein